MELLPFLAGPREHRPLEAAYVEDVRWLLAADSAARLGTLRAAEEALAAATNFAASAFVADSVGALEILLRSLPNKSTTEVILPAWAPRRLRLAVDAAGMTPVFADIDPETQIVDPESVRMRFTARTAAVIAWETDGRATKWQGLRALCDRLGAPLIVDASGSLPRGAEAPQARPHFLLLDFAPGTALAALCDGAALVGDDRALVEEIRLAAYAARARRPGRVIRTSEASPLEARALIRRLPTAGKRSEWRRAIARAYTRALEPLELQGSLCLPQDAPSHRWTGYCIRTAPGRDTLTARLRERVAGLPDPGALHLGVDDVARCPEAALLKQQALWLPCYAEMSPEDVEAVVETMALWAPRTLSTSYFISRSSRRTPGASHGSARAPEPYST